GLRAADRGEYRRGRAGGSAHMSVHFGPRYRRVGCRGGVSGGWPRRGGAPAVSTGRIIPAHPPMLGPALPVLAQRRARGRMELLVVLPDGSKSLIPAAWTDLDDADAEREAQVTPGQALGSVADLLHASTLTQALLARVQGAEQAARQSS